MLSNINKMAYFYARAQYELLFLVLVGNSAQFWILRSYTLLLKSPAVATSYTYQMVTENKPFP